MKRLLCVLLAVLLLSGCAADAQSAQRSIFAMDTLMDIQIWGPGGEQAADDIQQLLNTLECRWSATRQDSLISALNRGESPNMTQEEKDLLARLEELKQFTGGSFDHTLGALTQAWGFRDQNYRIPDGPTIQAAIAAKKLDMGAAMKGYACDRAVELLQNLDVQCALLNLGGNIQTFGTKPDGSPWRIAIQDPWGAGSLGVLTVTGTQSIVTSGSYQRFFDLDGQRYHHIMDATTGYPADSGLLSVTVICPAGLTADALSTALFVMGLEKGSAFWRENGGFDAVFVLTDGTVYATQGAVLSDCEYKEIVK